MAIIHRRYLKRLLNFQWLNPIIMVIKVINNSKTVRLSHWTSMQCSPQFLLAPGYRFNHYLITLNPVKH